MIKTALRKVVSQYNRITGPFIAQLMPARSEPVLLRVSPKKRSFRALIIKIATLAFAAALIFALGAGAGVLAEQRGMPDRVAGKLDLEHRLAAAAQALGFGPGDVQRAPWREVVLNQHTLEWASISVHQPGARGGALAAVSDFLVFSSPLGRFGYLSPSNELRSLPLQAPTNVEAIRDTPLSDHPLFMANEFRVHDLLARETAPNTWELFASLSRFERPGCYQFKIVRVALTASGGSLSLSSPQWEDVYTARPGCIPDKDHGWLFQGTEAGGRMVLLDANTMLVSIGDHQFDGYNSTQQAAMDPNWDLGKIIRIDLRSLESSIYTTGMRNPQGLVVMRDGRIFSTEHGPQGGDEINFIREGANYGWPMVSYGVNYGYPRSNWPTDPHPGGHSGFTRPAFAFVPSIGISNLVQPSAAEFPNWSDNDLLLLSLRAGTLFHVAVHDEEVAYVEPVDLSQRVFGPERLRDITTLPDGRNAILTDSGRIIFLRNADLHADAPRSLVVTGYSNLSAPLPEEIVEQRASSAHLGQQYFQLSCASCHSLDGDIGAGPPLNGVVGREIAGVGAFTYSSALSHRDGVWTENALRSFITNPSEHTPGTSMPSPGISWSMAPPIVDYLRTTRQAAPRN